MKKFSAVGVGIVFCFCNSLGALYSGNGDTSRGGAVGTGSLNLTDNGTTISATFNKGSGSFGDILVLFIDSTAGGFTDTTPFGDTSTALTRAISGLLDPEHRSTAIFANGFAADYAIALGVNEGIAIYQLASGGSGSLVQLRTLPHNNWDSPNQASYGFSFTWADLGLSGGSGFNFQSTYITSNGARYLESFESLSGTKDWGGTVTFANYNTYGNVAPIPEPANAALALFGGITLGLSVLARLRLVIISRMSHHPANMPVGART